MIMYSITIFMDVFKTYTDFVSYLCRCHVQGWTDHLETWALPEGPGSVGNPMRCPWYFFHRLF
ncbi:unnamed protein product [Staurois parvus]|uniref:Uncharacterized protein n=1 Tax=Staurois parvus TaxID=386267 RepID=A0ABN9H614_9NEOB|nr:unnamed protein product [Staurois parvus]